MDALAKEYLHNIPSGMPSTTTSRLFFWPDQRRTSRHRIGIAWNIIFRIENYHDNNGREHQKQKMTGMDWDCTWTAAGTEVHVYCSSCCCCPWTSFSLHLERHSNGFPGIAQSDDTLRTDSITHLGLLRLLLLTVLNKCIIRWHHHRLFASCNP